MSYFTLGICLGIFAIAVLLREVALGILDYMEQKALKKNMEAQRED